MEADAAGTFSDAPEKGKWCHCVTTYKKNAALRVWLETFLKYMDLESTSHVVICDDGGEAKEVYEEYVNRFPLCSKDMETGVFPVLQYLGGSRVGIAKNKNRGLKFFIEETKDDFVVLWDDDIEFVGSGIEERILKSKYAHVTGYLGDIRAADGSCTALPFGDTGNPFFVDFPPHGATEYLWFCGGSQGVMLFCLRKVVETVGYFNISWKGFYGYEHSIWSSRINRYFGVCPDWFPILKSCERYFQTQQVPNNYVAAPEENHKQYIDTFNEVMYGRCLVVKNPGV